MSNRLVALEDALRVLDEAGPQSITALARELEIRRLEARIVLLHAHWHGLARPASRDLWSISDRGRQALAGQLASPSIPTYVRGLRAHASAFLWRRRLRPGYLARGGVPLALGALVCVAGVAVASSGLPSGPVPPPIAKAQTRHLRHRRHRHFPARTHTLRTPTAITTEHRLERPATVTAVTSTGGIQTQRIRQHRRVLVIGARQLPAGAQRVRVAARHQRRRR
jgi:hypothetical protein